MEGERIRKVANESVSVALCMEASSLKVGSVSMDREAFASIDSDWVGIVDEGELGGVG